MDLYQCEAHPNTVLNEEILREWCEFIASVDVEELANIIRYGGIINLEPFGIWAGRALISAIEENSISALANE